MKYYSSNNYIPYKNDENQNGIEKDEFNYKVYLESIKNLENETNLSENKNFWNLLAYFCDSIIFNNNSIIIIDQYKSDYDKEEINNLKQLLSNYGENGFIKFIIASSLNDNSIKEDFKDDLISIYGDKIEQVNFLKDQTETDKIELEDDYLIALFLIKQIIQKIKIKIFQKFQFLILKMIIILKIQII